MSHPQTLWRVEFIDRNGEEGVYLGAPLAHMEQHVAYLRRCGATITSVGIYTLLEEREGDEPPEAMKHSANSYMGATLLNAREDMPDE